MTSNATRQLARVKINVIGGQVVAQAPQLGGRISSTSREEGDRRDQLTIEFTGLGPIVDYELTTPTAQLTVHLNRPDKPLLGLQPRSERSTVVPVEYSQDANGGLHLVVGAGQERREYRARSLWYLLLDEPEVSAEHLVPLLNVLRSDWQLLESAREIEQGMVRLANSQQFSYRNLWSDLVERLASDRFGERRAADRQLRQIGPAVVPFLESLDPSELDAEQRFRIRRIVDSLAGDESEDVPHRVSQAAAGDPRAWLALLDRDDASLRRLAVEQVSLLVDETIDYDPDAEAEVRDEQIVRLRARFDRSTAAVEEAP